MAVARSSHGDGTELRLHWRYPLKPHPCSQRSIWTSIIKYLYPCWIYKSVWIGSWAFCTCSALVFSLSPGWASLTVCDGGDRVHTQTGPGPLHGENDTQQQAWIYFVADRQMRREDTEMISEITLNMTNKCTLMSPPPRLKYDLRRFDADLWAPKQSCNTNSNWQGNNWWKQVTCGHGVQLHNERDALWKGCSFPLPVAVTHSKNTFHHIKSIFIHDKISSFFFFHYQNAEPLKATFLKLVL